MISSSKLSCIIFFFAITTKYVAPTERILFVKFSPRRCRRADTYQAYSLFRIIPHPEGAVYPSPTATPRLQCINPIKEIACKASVNNTAKGYN